MRYIIREYILSATRTMDYSYVQSSCQPSRLATVVHTGETYDLFGMLHLIDYCSPYFLHTIIYLIIESKYVYIVPSSIKLLWPRL